MSEQALTGLRDYLVGTLSVADMNWLAAELTAHAGGGELPLKCYTKQELDAMLDEAEAEIAAGRVIDDEYAWDELDEEHSWEETYRVAEAV